MMQAASATRCRGLDRAARYEEDRTVNGEGRRSTRRRPQALKALPQELVRALPLLTLATNDATVLQLQEALVAPRHMCGWATDLCLTVPQRASTTSRCTGLAGVLRRQDASNH